MPRIVHSVDFLMKLDRRAKKGPNFFGAVGAELLQSKASETVNL